MTGNEKRGRSASPAENCWEFKKCGREPGGPKVAELGVCPAANHAGAGHGLNNGRNGGRICWAVAGTYCGGKVQGTFPEKHLSCLACDFFHKVKSEQREDFTLLLPGQDYKPSA